MPTLTQLPGIGSGELFRLALRDFVFEWRLSSFMILALAAVLTPLLVLFGLKYGLIETLSSRLLEDPRNREIVVVGSGDFRKAWFQAKSEWPQVAFLLPRTRAIAATLYLFNPRTRPLKKPRLVDLIPSGENDPLLAGNIEAPTGYDEIVLSDSAARQLSVGVGDVIAAKLTRVRDKQREHVAFDLNVVGVLPVRAIPRDAALISLELLVATEDYRDGRAVSAFSATGSIAPQGDRSFAGFRLYARSIYDVPPLRSRLADEGLEIRTKAAEIENLQSLDRNLTLVFWIVALIGMGGYLLSLAANLWATVERKKRELSVLRLLGFSTHSIVLFPVVNAGFVGMLGSLFAALLYLPAQTGINYLFASSISEGEFVALLLPRHMLIAAGITLICAVLASTFAGYGAAQVEPSEGLRDV